MGTSGPQFHFFQLDHERFSKTKCLLSLPSLPLRATNTAVQTAGMCVPVVEMLALALPGGILCQACVQSSESAEGEEVQAKVNSSLDQ